MKILKTILTLIIEVAIIFLFAKFVNWTFMESFFLGSLAIFGLTWLFLLNMNRNANIDRTITKNLSGVNSGEITPFQIRMNPYMTGTLLLLTISFIITVIYYLPYFT
ncbi:hypothetical protein [Bacillus multifaciens]|uniref:hypothetical protein n=1 Tax=Bacillus multifaciens TaxID=3068506 RepID=UPI002740B10C|nr:hypothetical protein [Bacillus sp. WLY-B-L8]MDP7977127.1 hypothetical protein [Bacillus sp. WLY-B-L8]HDX9587819.1 hypothetical protein [Bacillus pseudomycoides]